MLHYQMFCSENVELISHNNHVPGTHLHLCGGHIVFPSFIYLEGA